MKRYFKWILIILILIIILILTFILISYGYYDYLSKNSYKIHCESRSNYVPCNTFSDCTQEKITEFCKAEKWSMGTKCDGHCNAKTFCLNDYCRSDSYMNTFLVPEIIKFNTNVNTPPSSTK